MEIIIDLLLELIIQVPMARVLALTIVPAFALLHFVRKRDWLEPESPRLVWSLFGIGVLSVIAAFVLEMFGMSLFLRLMDSQTVAFNLIHWFVIVGLAEEGSKYTLMRLRTWNNPEFDCMYDGVVYAVAVSAGFALAENVMYLIRYGGSVVLMRALVSIPGHISFAVFMGVFYAAAKKCQQRGSERGEIAFQLLALFVPALLHGLFDLAADSIKSRDIALF